MKYKIIFLTSIIFFLFSDFVFSQCPDRPDAIVDFVNNDICEGEIVNVINKSNENGNEVFYIWTWADGKKDTVYNKVTPNHIYNPICTTNGIYTFDFRLDVINKNKDCLSHYIQKPIYVYNKPKPDFDINPNPLCLPNSKASFSNKSCPSNLKYEWDFGEPSSGNLNIDTLKNTMHEYKILPNIYNVKLKATSKLCGSNEITKQLQVLEGPKAIFSMNPDKGCIPPNLEVNLKNSSTNFVSGKCTWTVSPSSGWSWKVPTNSKSDSPTIIFNKAGKYNINLKVEGCGFDDTTMSIEIKEKQAISLKDIEICGTPYTLDSKSIVQYSGGAIDQYKWTFEDATPSTSILQYPNNIIFNSIGNHKVTLEVTSECGTTSSSSYVNIYEMPKADFKIDSSSNANNCSPQTLFLNNKSTSSNTYSWSISPKTYTLLNGTKLTDQNIWIRFDIPSKYTIKLVASNNICGNSSDTKALDITIKQGVNITLDTIINQCDDFSFVPSMYSQIQNATSIDWEFFGGNPSTSKLSDPGLVKFSGIGSYKVTLKASNECGEKIVERTFKILEKPFLNIIDTLKNQSYCSPFNISLIDSSKYIENRKWIIAPNSGYNFIFGSDTSINPIIKFNVEGNYKISYFGSNSCGKVTWEKLLQIKQSPNVLLDSIIPECDQVVFNSKEKTSYSGSIDKYSWTFEKGSILNSSDQFPSPVNFITSGKFKIKIVVEGLCGIDSAINYVTVYNKEVIKLDSIPKSICNSYIQIQLNGLPNGGTWSGNNVTPSGIFKPLDATLGQNTLTYKIGSGSCEVKQSVNIEILGNKIDIGNDIIACSSDGLINLKSNLKGGVWVGKGLIDTLNGVFDPLLYGGGNYNLKYVYKDPINGCENSDSLKLKINVSPIASLDSINLICLNQPFSFNNKSSNIKTAFWDFGDGTNSVLQNPVKTYNSEGSFLLKLIVESNDGCKDTLLKTINVTPPPYINFSLDKKEECYPFPVNFTNSSDGYQVTYSWSFGNGEISMLKDPNPIIYNQGFRDTIYYVKLNVKNGCASLDKIDSVKVKPKPQVNFGTNVDDGCTPLKIKFSNLTVGNPKQWSWDFGNGISSIDSVPTVQIYTTDSIVKYYNIKLIVTNECGKDTLVKKITVKPVKSRAFFNIDTTSGCSPLTVRFTNFSSLGTQVYYDFGDGNKSFKPDTAHTYNKPGNYKVICYATDGCRYDSTIQYINVLPMPFVEFSSKTMVCENESIEFLNLSKDVFTYKWNFGDGDTSSVENPTHIFKEYGNYTVNLTSKSITTGCLNSLSKGISVSKSPDVNFTISKNDGCKPLTVNLNSLNQPSYYYKWDFGDGNTSTEKSPIHIYSDTGSYSIKLRVTDNLGCINDTIYNRVLVYPIPLSSFNYSQKDICKIPTVVNFKNNSIGADSYEWNFGNGTKSVLNNPSITYSLPTQYEVKLISKNQYGCIDSFSQHFKLYSSPTADFVINKQKICLGEETKITNLSTSLNNYKWDFGDGISSTITDPTHIYSKVGKYSITLFANNDNICFDTLKLTNLVEVLNKPISNFDWTDSLLYGKSVGIIRFINTSQDAYYYNWDFGDSNKSNLKNPIHRYYFNNNKNVELISINNNGCADTIIKNIKPLYFYGLYIPTAFSPENGLGDVKIFKPFGVGLKSFKIEIFSSFGQRVWYSDKLENGQPIESWDGTLNGQILPQDVFIWKVNAIFENGQVWLGNGENEFNKSNIGTVTLIR